MLQTFYITIAKLSIISLTFIATYIKLLHKKVSGEKVERNFFYNFFNNYFNFS